LLELAGLERIDAVEHSLDASLQHAERRAQLVREIRHEIAALAVRVLQPLRHRVERTGEGAHGRWAALRHARRIVSVGHAFRGIHHGAQRRCDAAHHPQRAAGTERRQRRADHHGDESAPSVQAEPRGEQPGQRDDAADREQDQHESREGKQPEHLPAGGMVRAGAMVARMPSVPALPFAARVVIGVHASANL
jgi:hypothetical protein